MQLLTRVSPIEEPRLDERAIARARRVGLDDTAFIDHVSRAVLGDEALFERLAHRMRWTAARRAPGDRVADMSRLLASIPADGPGDPLLDHLSVVLTEKYGRRVDRITLTLCHGRSEGAPMLSDRAEGSDDGIVAILALRGPRRIVIRPRREAGGLRRAFDLGHGDLLVMGGSAQRDFDHGVSKGAAAQPRMAVVLRSSS